jgi:hypothetical protein
MHYELLNNYQINYFKKEEPPNRGKTFIFQNTFKSLV